MRIDTRVDMTGRTARLDDGDGGEPLGRLVVSAADELRRRDRMLGEADGALVACREQLRHERERLDDMQRGLEQQARTRV